MSVGIQAIGALTPLGFNAPLTIGSIHAGIQLFGDLPVSGADGEPITGARVALPQDMAPVDRVLTMALSALHECAAIVPAGKSLPLVLSVPDAMELGLPAAVRPDGWLDAICARTPIAIDREQSRVLTSGRDGSIQALLYAKHLLSRDPGAACYFVAADTFVSTNRLQRLAAEGRLLSDVSPGGFLPSEGAVSLLLRGHADHHSLAAITSIAAGEEAGRMDGEPAVNGMGLCGAMQRALVDAGLRVRDLGCVVPDLAEKAAFQELSLAWSSFPVQFLAGATHESQRLFPCQFTGHLGAAAGPLTVALLAFLAGQQKHKRSGLALWTSETAPRAAVTVAPVAREQKKQP